MNIQDLETIHRLNLPIKFFVLNNGGYGSIRNSQDNYFDGFYVGAESSSGVTLPEIERIAYAYKIPYFKISNNDEMYSVSKKDFDTEGPVLCEVMVSTDERTLPRTKSVVMEDGKMRSMPFEDLYPFLDREEFNSVMNQFKED
jgi:acetolactate synthase-1/2/3 large subunit